jgi:transposase
METLEQFIAGNPHPVELKRALAVQMSQRGQSYRDIRDILQVSLGFISASRQRYERAGVEGLRSHYWGTAGYLSAQQKQQVFRWLDRQDSWTLEEVIEHIEQEYRVVYQSLQSYYALLKQAGFSWKKAQPAHPSKDEQLIQEKKEKLQSYWQRTAVRLPVDVSEFCFSTNATCCGAISVAMAGVGATSGLMLKLNQRKSDRPTMGRWIISPSNLLFRSMEQGMSTTQWRSYSTSSRCTPRTLASLSFGMEPFITAQPLCNSFSNNSMEGYPHKRGK